MELQHKAVIEIQFDEQERRIRNLWLISTLLNFFISLIVEFYLSAPNSLTFPFVFDAVLSLILSFAALYYFAYLKYGNAYLVFSLIFEGGMFAKAYMVAWASESVFINKPAFRFILLITTLAYLWWIDRSIRLLRLNQAIRFKMADGDSIENQMMHLSNEQELINFYKKLVVSRPQDERVITAIYKKCKRSLVTKE